ncbi:LamB/YcsF family protein [Fusibacter ferrireducens]|uniref:5-oxoprolinase subunit A n=1 Tax=Fusibacter ferrireducens TaxID=2785058 RepID=A0ABR9ZXQ3_9FIRM|nr:5-oxoprolinase subunit PxpA [Fusibacter ferrireducens]MBF4695246.1 LamB/YcsF family protein [Fusibacter ferrireducens]
MMKIDINSDLGESFGNYTLGMDAALLSLISSANIACGWHAGDANVMAQTVRDALENNVAIGCHPGFPDLLGFGRRTIQVSPQELKNYVKYQIGALNAFVTSEGGVLKHVKPHGAMYNMAARDEKLAHAIAEAIYEINPEMKLMGLSGSQMITSAQRLGLKTISEVFADRAYLSDGSLVPRSQKGAVIHDREKAIEQVMQMVKTQTVTALSGEKIEIEADSICVHGDNQKAIEFVMGIRKHLIGEGIQIKAV